MSPADNDKPRPRLRIEFLPGLRSRPSTVQRSSGTQVLVVDDEANIARLVQVNLERYGYQMETASNGAEALAMIRKCRPDLLVTDNWMPEMNGYELLKEIRRDPALEDLPVILMEAPPLDKEHLASPKTDACLTKPFNPAELITFTKRTLPREDSSFELIDV